DPPERLAQENQHGHEETTQGYIRRRPDGVGAVRRGLARGALCRRRTEGEIGAQTQARPRGGRHAKSGAGNGTRASSWSKAGRARRRAAQGIAGAPREGRRRGGEGAGAPTRQSGRRLRCEKEGREE